LGKVFLLLQRHETDVTRLTDLEQQELWHVMTTTKKALSSHFAPDHFSFAFLMSIDPHVHLHVVPRYATPRTFAGQEFVDGQFGHMFGSPERVVSIDFRVQLVETLQRRGLTPPLDGGKPVA
jgi:diadenosine tetraphosphate (Ap4A) HIT family hydrolase